MIDLRRFTSNALATPLRDFLPDNDVVEATILGSSATAAYLAAGDFVVALTARGVPLMPNGASMIESRGLEVFEAGTVARISETGLAAGPATAAWAGAESLDLAVPHNPEHDVAAVARRGSDLLAASGHGPDPLAALTVARPHLLAGGRLLLYALRDRDPELAGDAARALTGRGPGLTPDGDDLLAASAAATRAFGAATAYPDAGAEALRSALVLDDLGERTGALSASLLRLAVDGRVIDPVRALLDLSAGAATWTGALARLERIGHGTGGTYALGCALTALALSAGDQPSSMNPRREEKS